VWPEELATVVTLKSRGGDMSQTPSWARARPSLAILSQPIWADSLGLAIHGQPIWVASPSLSNGVQLARSGLAKRPSEATEQVHVGPRKPI